MVTAGYTVKPCLLDQMQPPGGLQTDCAQLLIKKKALNEENLEPASLLTVTWVQRGKKSAS